MVDGHLRLKAAIRLGLPDVPVALADDLTEAQVRAFRLAESFGGLGGMGRRAAGAGTSGPEEPHAFCAAFTTTAGFKIVNLSGLTPRTTVLAPTDLTLADDTVVDGVLGDRLRLKITSTGTFGSGSVISARVACR